MSPEGRKLVREPLKVIIILEHYRITGTIYLDLDERLSDFINANSTFIPVRDTVMEGLDGKERKEYKFLNVNKEFIIAIFPENQQS